MTAAVELRHVAKSFNTPDGFALSNVDLVVGRGEMVAIMGPSGSGKSTLLNLMGLLDRPSSGQITLAGVSAGEATSANLAKLRAMHIGFVFQSPHLLPRFNALDNVAMGARYLRCTRRARYDSARQLIDRVGLSHRMTAYPPTLSGGEQQRVAIARALMGEKDLLLCDEPTGNLDRKSSTRIVELIRERSRAGPAVIVVTHDGAVADQADRTLQLVDGSLVT